MRIAQASTQLSVAALSLLAGVAGAVLGARLGGEALVTGFGAAVLIALFGLRRPIRRLRTARRALPAGAVEWLQRHVRIYTRLDASAQARFRRDVGFVLDEWTFEGVRGVEVTDDLRFAVAAGAALLLNGRPDWELSSRRSVLFYPEAFDEDYYEGESGPYDGMAHHQGPVILSVRAVRESWNDDRDGSNVVLHELAHLLDFERYIASAVPSDAREGFELPVLLNREMIKARRGRSVLRPYAGTNPEELFAVGVEAFFERPIALARHHRALYDVLCVIFRQDPAAAFLEPGTPESTV